MNAINFNFDNDRDLQVALAKFEKATATDELWIDKKGKVHCDGLITQLIRKIGAFFSWRPTVKHGILKNDVAQILNHALKQKKISKAAADRIFQSYSTYEVQHSTYKCLSLFDKIFHTKSVRTMAAKPIALQAYWKQCGPKPTVTNELRDASARKIQEAYRALRSGRKVRDTTVMPHQILPRLKEYLKGIELLEGTMGSNEREDFTLAICREIQIMSTNPEKFRGKSVQLLHNEREAYHLPQLKGSTFKQIKANSQKNLPPRKVKLKVDCWLEMPQDASKIDLLVCTKVKLGNGTYKTVYKAERFSIELKINHKPGHSARTVDHQFKAHSVANPNTPKTEKSPAYDLQSTFKAGIGTHRKLMQMGVRVPPLPTNRLPDAETGKVDDLETIQDMFNTDLWDATYKGGVPLELHLNSPKREILQDEKLQVFIDLADTLVGYHATSDQTGARKTPYVHRDIKAPNVWLMKIDGALRGALGDFDLVQSIGTSTTKGFYDYWDKSSQNGWIIPLVDCYGMAMTFGDVLLPKFDTVRLKPDTFDKAVIAEKILAELQSGLIKIFTKDRNKIERFRDPAEINVFLAECTKASKSLSQKQHAALSQLQKQWALQMEVLEIVSSMIKSSRDVYDYILAHPQIQTMLKSDDPDTRLNAVQNIERDCPYLSAKEIRDRLVALQKQFKKE